MAFRNVFSNVTAVSWNGLAITGVEEITLTEDAGRVAAGADNDLHESVQFMGMRTTQVTMVLQTPPPFSLPVINTGTDNQKTLLFTVKGRMGASDRLYTITAVQWFSLNTNGAFGNMRKWNLTGHAITEAGGATPVGVVSS